MHSMRLIRLGCQPVLRCAWLLKGAVTSITEPAAADMTYAFGLFYGGFVQLLAGMWEMYKVSAAPRPMRELHAGGRGKVFPCHIDDSVRCTLNANHLTSACTLK